MPARLSVLRLTVRAGRIEADVEVSPPGARSTPELARAVLASFPRVGDHACVNGKGRRFSDVMEDTPLPHVLEHLVVELQVRAFADREGAGRVFAGTSEWEDGRRRRARVQVSFADDLTALRAFRDATAFLNGALAEGGAAGLRRPDAQCDD